MQLVSLAAAALIVINLLVLPYFVFLLVSALAALAARPGPRTPGEHRTRFLIVIPAHNEEEGLAATVRSCLALEYPREMFRVLVLADNCTDATAAVARAEGAEVAERFDETKKSKGFAIEWLIEGLKGRGEFDTHDALVVIDADSTASANLLDRLADELENGSDWAQCFYTVANPDDSWRTRLLTYAFTLFNGVVPLGQWALGGSAGFKGNGMCFSTRGLDRVPWRCRGLVEDMEYSWEVRLGGGRIAFVPDARVFGVMLAGGGPAAAAQRRRWEFGRKALVARVLPELLRSRRLGLLERLISLVELTLPPLATLGAAAPLLLALDLVAAANLGWPTVSAVLLCGLGTLMLATLLLYIISPFLALLLPWRYLSALGYAPGYAVWKLVVGLGGKPTQWVRTARESPAKR